MLVDRAAMVKRQDMVRKRKWVCRCILILTCLFILITPCIVQAGNAIESVIVSKFKGLDHGNIYELQNGQIWKQTEYWIWIWVRSRVLIYQDGGVYKMKMENIDHPVTVERIK